MIVGMHRSGTSFLTGSLQQAGLELGSHSAWNPHNLKGNRENQDIVSFHDRVLAAHGASWDRPPGGAVQWSAQETAEARELVAGYRALPLWGFKDPRGLLLVHGWRKVLPALRFVGIFRHPAAVAQSLAARGGMPANQALELWNAYNLRLLALHEQVRFPLLCFDEDEPILHAKLAQMLHALGLAPAAGERFFSSELRHHGQLDVALPADIAALLKELRARAL